MPHSILIIEDEPVLARNLRTFFEGSGDDVCCVGSAADGERQIAVRWPDLVILSHQPPRIDGLALLRKLRRAGCELKVVVISADATLELAVESIKLGAVEFLGKPLALSKLRRVAESVLGVEAAEAPAVHFRLGEMAWMRAAGRR